MELDTRSHARTSRPEAVSKGLIGGGWLEPDCPYFSLSLCAGGLLSREVEASEGLELTWSALASCPPAADVEAEIERALLRVRAKSRVKVLAEVSEAGAEGSSARPWLELRVRVEHAGEIGERTIAASSCDEAVRATALFVALAVEIREPPAPPPAPPPTVPPTVPPPEREEPRNWLLSVGPHVALGELVPEVMFGGGLGFGFTRAAFRAELRASFFSPREQAISGTEFGGTYSLASAGAFVCGGLRFEPLALFGCGGGRLARLGAAGFGATSNGSQTTYIGTLSLGADLEWRLSAPFQLRAGIEGGYAPGASRFVIENVGTAFETGRLSGEARLELGWLF